MKSDPQERNDLATLHGVIRGPGNYATPSADRVQRLIARGWAKRDFGAIRRTLKGRLVAVMSALKQLGYYQS